MEHKCRFYEEIVPKDEDDGERVGLVLTATQAIAIYRCKLGFRQPRTFESCLLPAESRIKGQSVPVAHMFGVSPKTVRDIWNRRTWAYTTAHLWTEEEDNEVPVSLVGLESTSPKHQLFLTPACSW
jgi:hypothetical protein